MVHGQLRYCITQKRSQSLETIPTNEIAIS